MQDMGHQSWVSERDAMQHSSKSVEQALEHAGEILELHLSGRRLSEFPKIPAHIDISDLLCAGALNNRL